MPPGLLAKATRRAEGHGSRERVRRADVNFPRHGLEANTATSKGEKNIKND